MGRVRGLTLFGVLFAVGGLVGVSHAVDRAFSGAHPMDVGMRAVLAASWACTGYGLVRRAPWSASLYAGTSVALVAILAIESLAASDPPTVVLVGVALVAAVLAAIGRYLGAALRREQDRDASPGSDPE